MRTLLSENVLEMRRGRVCPIDVVHLPDIPHFQAGVLSDAAPIVSKEPQAAEVGEIVRADADVALLHPGLRNDEDSAHGSRCSSGTSVPASRSAARERWHARGSRSTQRSSGTELVSRISSIDARA